MTTEVKMQFQVESVTLSAARLQQIGEEMMRLDAQLAAAQAEIERLTAELDAERTAHSPLTARDTGDETEVAR